VGVGFCWSARLRHEVKWSQSGPVNGVFSVGMCVVASVVPRWKRTGSIPPYGVGHLCVVVRMKWGTRPCLATPLVHLVAVDVVTVQVSVLVSTLSCIASLRLQFVLYIGIELSTTGASGGL
jgi:hypothetical protein